MVTDVSVTGVKNLENQWVCLSGGQFENSWMSASVHLNGLGKAQGTHKEKTLSVCCWLNPDCSGPAVISRSDKTRGRLELQPISFFPRAAD